MVEVDIEAFHKMFVDGYKITTTDSKGQIKKYYMKFEDGIKNVFKWNVLSPFLARLKIISSDYHIASSQKRWENEIRILSYIRKRLKEKDYPVYVPKVMTKELKSLNNPKLKEFLNKWKDYRFTILEYIEGPTFREILSQTSKYNLENETRLLGKCIGVIHSLGVCQFDRRTTNDIRIPKGYASLDYSLGKIFKNFDMTYYLGTAFDIDNQRLWLPEKLMNIFLESHDKYLSSIKDFDIKKYEYALKQTKRLSKLSIILKPILYQLDSMPL